MSDKIKAYCKRCEKEQIKRLVKEKRPNRKGYYTCVVCAGANSKKHRHRNWFRYLAQKANKREKPNSEKMTEEILKAQLEKQRGVCALSGVPFDMSNDLMRPSLDRIDSSKGYTKENIQIVLFIINKMKRELVQKDFLSMCFNVAQWLDLQAMPYLQHINVYGGSCGD